MMALSGVRSSWLILARNSDLARLAVSASAFCSRYFSARSASCCACSLERLPRPAQIGDGRHQTPLGIHQLLFVMFQRGDVGADRDIAAVLRAPFVDLQPAAVGEARFIGLGAGLLARIDGAISDWISGAAPLAITGRIGQAGRRSPHSADCGSAGTWNCT